MKMWCSRTFPVRKFCSDVYKLKPFKSSCSSGSSLRDIFNTTPPKNGLLEYSNTKENVGLFNVPELTTPSGFFVLQKQCEQQTKNLVQEALSKNRKRKMVEIFDELSDSLCRVADLAEFIRLAHPIRQFSKSAEQTCIAVSEIVEQLNTNRKLYDNLKKSVSLGDVVQTTEIDRLVGELFLFDFEQNGIHLDEDLRNEVVGLNNLILNLGQQFMAGSDAPRVVDKSVVPPNIRDLFTNDGDNIIVSGLFIDSLNPVTREMAYRIYYYPDENQDVLLRELMSSRYFLAKTCGFNSYSERVLRGGTVDNPKDVMDFLKKTSNNIETHANFEMEQMSLMKKSENNTINNQLSVWDVPYYTLKAKRDWFKVTKEQYSPYFSLGACMEGLNMIFENLYRISLVNVPLSNGECWSNDVYKLSVEHETEGILGYIYCDFYERNGKQNQDCHFTIRGGKELNGGTYQVPIAVLMLNLKAPTWGTPALLTPQNVDNLFHEMGHAMHSMLARTKYQHVTGTRCSTDFAEVPSVLMEYFAADPRILRMFARHYQTNMPIPEEMLQRLCASKKIFTACETRLQIFYSVLDQVFHSENPVASMDHRIVAQLQEKYYGLKFILNTAWHLRFGHLVGYGSKYYSYLVSRSVAHSIWHNYFKTDPLDGRMGEKYRRECLAHGGGKNPKKLVADFLGIEASPEVLANSLVTEIEDNQRIVNEFRHNVKV